jgi:hypothetical protein
VTLVHPLLLQGIKAAHISRISTCDSCGAPSNLLHTFGQASLLRSTTLYASKRNAMPLQLPMFLVMVVMLDVSAGQQACAVGVLACMHRRQGARPAAGPWWTTTPSQLAWCRLMPLSLFCLPRCSCCRYKLRHERGPMTTPSQRSSLFTTTPRPQAAQEYLYYFMASTIQQSSRALRQHLRSSGPLVEPEHQPPQA